jgi:hypothetical protein
MHTSFPPPPDWPTASNFPPGAGLPKPAHQAEEACQHRVAQPEVNADVLHHRLGCTEQLRQLLHLIVQQRRVLRRLELGPKGLLFGPIILSSEIGTGIRGTP